ncbi:tRNA pseudouridine(38-40) synthase TruA [Litorihabitans aurantiacus]|uniref:tRNA pseudouridine synthase A n=1 Tax=Litorihabitans aurantiacus TaxID=1930061 RepID=A0AA37XFB0_9MICO|nr:tRNA pseudouridine(38-40) synthase TruA [Litorihabitans aurantiacus]GMA32267.1 tRNA pseudouridine synthase A [Litorihabitans aurantiacus]
MPTSTPDVVRLRLDVAYDGTDFSGWAVQPGRRTVQGELTRALDTVLRTPVTLTVAGRTDAGVHARGQVVHLDVPRAAWEAVPGRSDRAPGDVLVTRVAGVAPADVVLRRAAVVPDAFDARFSALWRRYTYRIDDGAAADPLTRAWVLRHRRALDAPAMHDAVRRLLGEHDFLAYCRPREGATTIRTLQEAAVGREAGVVAITVRADAFCHSMVRSLVGALLAVGEGRREVAWPREVLDAVRRDGAVAVAPPTGLVLEEVGYPPDAELAERARTARAVRTLGG